VTPTPEVERAAAEAIDAANAEDPTSLLVDGVEVPTQLLLGRLASEWVGRLDPGASASQRIAARGHHLRRWESPRSDYPAGRAGYLRWRRDQKARHAADLAGLLTGVAPVAGAAAGVILGGPPPRPLVWLGVALVASGLALGLPASRHPRPAPQGAENGQTRSKA